MKTFVVLYPKGTPKPKIDHMCSLFRYNNPEAKVTRKMSPTLTSIGLLIIDKRRGSP